MKLKIQKKHLSAAIVLVLMLSMTISLLATASVGAQTEKIKTYAIFYQTPNPVGIGQTIYVVALIAPPPHIANYVFKNLTITITKPSGNQDVMVVESDPAATYSFDYVCDELGTWSVRLDWPGDSEDVFGPPFEPVSASTTWVVQQDPVAVPFVDNNPVPLPTGFWSYPISAENREWYQLSGAWKTPSAKDGTDGTRVNLYSKGPTSAHILWKNAMTSAGQLVGGDEGWLAVKPGWPTTDIVSALGNIYYPIKEGTGTTTHPILVCQDLNTGEIEWEKDLPYDSTGSSFPRLAGIEFTSSTKLNERDPVTGNYVTLPSAASLWLVSNKAIWEVDLTTGTLLNYIKPTFLSQYGTINHQNLELWGSYLYFMPYKPSQDIGKEVYTGNVTKFDCRKRAVVWTRDVCNLDIKQEQIYNNTGLIGWDLDEKNQVLVLCMDSRGGWPTVYKLFSWNATTGDPIAAGPNLVYSSTSGKTICVDDGMSFYHASDMKYHAISVFTGKEIWSSEPCEAPWGLQGTYGGITAYDGRLYGGTHDGYIYCFEEATGKTLWKYFCGDTTETAYGHLVPFGSRFVADGKVYCITGEHTPPDPPPRGNKLLCLDAYTGDLLWSYPFMCHNMVGMGSGIASGILWAPNQYDGCLYAFGKGPTATTVTAPSTVVPLGDSVLIQGTVTDQSSGSKDTPAISDASMSDWMAYLYQQWPEPMNATGVTVHLQAMASDGSIIDITHVTSDIMGHYEFMWAPPDEDTYKILATFEGSESYWSSSAQTALGVGAARATSEGVTTAPDYTSILYAVIAGVIAIIIAVAIVGILMLRKRP